MKLPNADQALVDREKITKYLMNPAHPDNGGKAQFFTTAGFGAQDWPTLADALAKLASKSFVRKRSESAHGEKYVVDGWLETPTGKQARVRTIWIIDRGMHTPRLVTAYPHQE